jgi:porphobilinogen synthase
MAFPCYGPSFARLVPRRTEQLRVSAAPISAQLVRETRLTPEAFVYPMFVCPGEGMRKAVRSMPGVFNLSVDEAVKEAQEVHSLGVPAVILFGLPDKKDDVATGAWADDGIVQQAARAMKREVPDLILMGDVCLCEYMSHGHCGIVPGTPQPNLGAAARDAVRLAHRGAVAVSNEEEKKESSTNWHPS